MDKHQQQAVAIEIKKVWERVYSILLPAASRVRNQDQCRNLSALPANQRADFVVQHWGMTALQKVQPFLSRVEILEGQN